MENDSLQALRRDFEEHREQTKQSEPGLIRAVATFFADYQAYKTGERQRFPQAAALGVIFAYLRPRLVIVIGSVLIATFTAVQVWLLFRQNQLIQQQNSFIDRQGRALEAQTVAVLLSGLDDDKKVPASRLSLLLAYGDIGSDALIRLAGDMGEVGGAARTALIASADRLTTGQAGAVFKQGLDAYIVQTIAKLRERAESKVAPGESDPAAARLMPRVSEAMGIPSPMSSPQTYVAMLPDSFERFVLTRRMTADEIVAHFPGHKLFLVKRMALYYALSMAGKGLQEPPLLNEQFTALCGKLAGAPVSDLGLTLREFANSFDPAGREQISVLTFAGVIVGEICLPESPDIFMIGLSLTGVTQDPPAIDLFLAAESRDEAVEPFRAAIRQHMGKK